VLSEPDLHFQDPGGSLTGGTGLTDPVYVPLGSFGEDNHTDPGGVITESPSPTVPGVGLTQGAAADGHLNFLLDTGAQLTVISTAVAQDLGLNLNNPSSWPDATSIDVQGVGGTETVNGFTLDKLDLPRTDGGVIEFTNVPIYVLDVDPQLAGLLGTNLWDTASTMLIDPHNPGGGRLGLTFFTDPNRGTGGDLSGIDGSFLKALGGPFGGLVNRNGLPGFGTPTGASITGQVFQDTNGSGARDLGEPDLAGVKVYLDGNNNGRLDPGEPTAVTDAHGSYWFTGLAAGTYTVREVLPAGWVGTTAAARSVHLSAQQHAAGVNFGDFQPGSVSGHVFHDHNGNGVQDSGDAGLPGVRVFLDANGNGKLDPGERSVLTGPDGAYSFAGLGPGSWAVREVVPAGWLRISPSAGSYPVHLSSGQPPVTGDDFADFVPGIIAGRVLTRAGVPLAGFRVFLDLNGDGRFDAGDRSVLTNALGAYAFTGLGPGTYVVREVVPRGWHLVAPAGGAFSVLVTSGRRALGLNFWDFRG
jgi:protocatechuate 3,4-dioxygenase beta subunit